MDPDAIDVLRKHATAIGLTRGYSAQYAGHVHHLGS
jgi:hypothetical protein